jgi:hypothetical protein
VIAEVITGILLGPSVMGFVPGFTVNIFPTTSITIFNGVSPRQPISFRKKKTRCQQCQTDRWLRTIIVIANVGLILFMFLVGLEVDPALMRRNLKGSAVISITAMVLPFVLGIGASAYIWNEMPMVYPPPPPSLSSNAHRRHHRLLLLLLLQTKTATFASFLLFVGVAVSITAFPVLARILTDQGLTQSKVGIIALSSAAVDDVTYPPPTKLSFRSPKIGRLTLTRKQPCTQGVDHVGRGGVDCPVVRLAHRSVHAAGLRRLRDPHGGGPAAHPQLALQVRRPADWSCGWPLLTPSLRTTHRRAHARETMKHEFVILILVLLFISAWTTDVRAIPHRCASPG